MLQIVRHNRSNLACTPAGEKWRLFDLMWRKQWHPTPVLLPGTSHGWRSLEGCSPWGRWGSDTTEQLHFHISLSCIGKGNGNPLQCSCLGTEEPGGLPSMGSHRVGHDWSDLAAAGEGRDWIKERFKGIWEEISREFDDGLNALLENEIWCQARPPIFWL